jgi:hypothetical protein
MNSRSVLVFSDQFDGKTKIRGKQNLLFIIAKTSVVEAAARVREKLHLFIISYD